MQRASVLLPQPDSPTMPSVSPGASSSETSRSACRWRRGWRVSSVARAARELEALVRGLRAEQRQPTATTRRRPAHPISPTRRQALQMAGARPRSATGTTSRQASTANAQRGWKRQPGGGAAEVRRLAVDRAAAARRGACARAAREQRPRVGVRGPANTCRGCAGLDDLAGVHHGDPVAGLRDDAQVVGDQQHAHAGFGAQLQDQLQDLVLHRDVERGGRLVGDQQARPAGQRDGDQHALAHAAAERVRIVDDGAAPGAGRRPRPASRSPRSRACARLRPRCRCSPSAIWAPIRIVGLSEVIGSWKIIAISLPRSALPFALVERERDRARRSGRCRSIALGRRAAEQAGSAIGR